jgi:hypothetical protein
MQGLPQLNFSFAGVLRFQCNTIRACLGHVSLETTNIYAEVDLERKAQALAQYNVLQVASRNPKRWRDDPSLIAYLRAL